MKRSRTTGKSIYSIIAVLLLAVLVACVFVGNAQLAHADATVSNWATLKQEIGKGGTQTITLDADFAYDGTSIEIPNGADITIAGDHTIFSSAQDAYESMFSVKSGGNLTIAAGVTLSGKIGEQGQTCPDPGSNATYTNENFTGAYADGAKTYTPKGFFIDVEAGGTATLNGTVSDFVTSRNKETTPRYVAPVVANGAAATFNLGATGVIKNNVVGYIVDEDKAYTNAQEIKQYVKGAAPNSLRKPGAYDQKQDREKYERVRERNAGIDGGSPGTGITATAGAVIYKDGATGNIEGTIDNNRGDTGGVMTSGENTEVHIKGNTVISRNVGVQFGGGSTTEQGAILAMHSGTMKQNVAWFGGGAVFATQNGVDWLLGYMVDDTGKPVFDDRLDGKFAMAGGTLTENTAFTRGGAILVDSNGVAVKAGKLTNNMSWMLGGAVYVMGDHPRYTYTMHIDPVYVHDNLAVSGKDQARANAATSIYSKAQLDEKNALLQRKLAKVGRGCADPGSGDLFDGTISANTDDPVDGQGNDGTGGGVWLCPFGSVVFDAARTDAVVIDSNYATGTIRGSNDDSKYNSNASATSRSGISAGSDLHTDQGKQGGGVSITGLEGGGWVNENTNQPYTTETSSNRTNLVSTREIGSDDVPYIYTHSEMVEVTGNIARRGGGLASNGKFYFGPLKSTADLNAKMAVSKVWTPSANTEPIAIRIIAQKGDAQVVVADVPLDGIENPPVSEFDTVSELAPDGNTWTGEFALPYVVTDANGENIKLFSLYHNGEEIDLTLLTGRQKLGELLKNDKQGEVVVRAAEGVTLIFKEMNVEKDGDGNWVATSEEHTTHVFTPNSIDFANLQLTKEKAEETMEDVIDPDTGEITQKPSFGTYTAGLALQLETGNDNEAIVEKYVNKDVHANIVNFDQDFTYDIMAYVPIMAKEFTVSDTLVPGLEFADKNGNAVTNKSTVEKISVKTINDHKPEGAVSQAGMPDSEGKEIDLTNGNASIQIVDGNKLVVTIDENTTYVNKSGVNKNALDELHGRWLQVTFHARIKDEYRNIDALKALQDAGNKQSWLEDGDDKFSDQRHDATLANGDLVLADALFGQFSMGPDPIIWAVEAPSRLFAKTASGAYYATPMNDKSGSMWSKLEDGSDDWKNANNRYSGTPPEANNTRRALATEGADAGLVAALKEMPLIKGAQLGKGAEGQERIFIEVYNPKAVSDDNPNGYEIYATTTDDHKSGRLWEKLTPGSTPYKNAVDRLRPDRYTLRMLDFEAEGITLSKDSANWPVISEDVHKGMSNQASYDVTFGNGSESSHRSNIVTVEPETTEIDVQKTWKPDAAKWPADVTSVTFNVYSVKNNDEKQVYVDAEGKVVGAFAESDTKPDGAKPLTIALTKDDENTPDVDESRSTVRELPKLKRTVYVARETIITYIDGDQEKNVDVNYKDSAKTFGVTQLGENGKTVVTSIDSKYKGDGIKLAKLATSNNLKPLRGAIADNRLWAMSLDGRYFFTAAGDTDGNAEDSEWTQITAPASTADSESDAVKNYDRAVELLGENPSSKPTATDDGITLFDVTGVFTAVNESASTEKYVNNDVHADLVEFDKAFKYDIMVYVPTGTTELTISDPLKTNVLEFAKKKDNLDAANVTAAEKATTADESIAAIVVKASNDHTADSTVAGKDSDNPGTDISAKVSSKSIDGNALTIKFEGESDPAHEGSRLPLDFAGNWVQVTFWAKYTDVVIEAANAGEFDKIRDNGAVVSEKYPSVAKDAADEEFSHDGTKNQASADIKVGDDATFSLNTNEVTVKSEKTKVFVRKEILDIFGKALAQWPEGLVVKANVLKNVKGSTDAPEVVQQLELTDLTVKESEEFPKLIGVTYTVEEVELNSDKYAYKETQSSGTEEDPFVITNNTLEPEIEKYVNQKVHAELETFDEPFTYDIMAYVPAGATKIVISDTLIPQLDIVSTAEDIAASAHAKEDNNHTVDGVEGVEASVVATGDPVNVEGEEPRATATVSTKDDTGTAIEVTVDTEGGTLDGKWVQVTIEAKISKDAYADVAKKLEEDPSTAQEGINWARIVDNTPVQGGEGEHAGLLNKASYRVYVGENGTSDYFTNTVTVKPKRVKTSVEKKWVAADGTAMKWPDDVASVTMKVTYANGDETQEEILTLTADAPKKETREFNRLVGAEFTVTEVTQTPGFTTGDATGSADEGFVITNTAVPEPAPKPTSAVIVVNKVLQDASGASTAPEADAFTFTLKVTGPGGYEKNLTATNSEAEGAQARFEISDLETSGEYSYEITEVAGDDSTITYDTAVLSGSFHVAEFVIPAKVENALNLSASRAAQFAFAIRPAIPADTARGASYERTLAVVSADAYASYEGKLQYADAASDIEAVTLGEIAAGSFTNIKGDERYLSASASTVTKTWDDGGNTKDRAPVTFQLYRKVGEGEFEPVEGKTVTIRKPDDKGVWAATFNALPAYVDGQPASYYAAEANAGDFDGLYVPDEQIVIVDLESTSGMGATNHPFTPNTSIDIEVSKRATGAKAGLPGAKLQILDYQGSVVEEWTSTKDAHVMSNMAVGLYTLHEVSAPSGYEKAADIAFRVNVDGSVEVREGNTWKAYGEGGIVMYDKPKTSETSKTPETPRTPETTRTPTSKAVSSTTARTADTAGMPTTVFGALALLGLVGALATAKRARR